MTKRALVLTLPVAILLAGAPCALAARTAEPPTDVRLNGVWELDADLSDRPMDRMSERRPRRGGIGGGGSGRLGGGFRGGRGGGLGRGGTPQMSREEMEARIETMRQRHQRLLIAQEEGTFSVLYGDGTQTVLTTDGKKQTIDRPEGQVEAKARWKGERLVVTSELDGHKVKETYELAGEGKLLRVIAELDTPRGNLKIRRVYRPALDDSEEEESGLLQPVQIRLLPVRDARRAQAPSTTPQLVDPCR